MAEGYWGPGWNGCRCCHSGPKAKFLCLECGHVCKAPDGGSPRCPFGHGPMQAMGQKWRPGPKRNRSRIRPTTSTSRRYVERMLTVEEWVARGRYRSPSPGETLLARLTAR